MTKQEIEELLKTDLFKELELDNLSLDEKIYMFSEMADVIFQSIWVRVLENLDENQREILANKILANEFSTPDELNNYLKSLIPNLDDLMKEEIANYKKILLSKI